jgi:primosomal protein N'
MPSDKLSCPVCENEIEIPEGAKEGSRLTCQNCFAQLALYHHGGEKLLGCAFCKEPVFDPEKCADCERRHEKKKIIEEGRL